MDRAKNLKQQVLTFVRKGQNVSVFGMETSGHNTLVEEALTVRKKNEFLGIIDPRYFDKFDEEKISRGLLLSLVNSSKEIKKYGTLERLIFESPKSWKLWFVIKNTELALAKFPQLITFLRSFYKLRRGKVVLIFAGNHHCLRESTVDFEDSNVFLDNVLLNEPYGIEESRAEVFLRSFVPKSFVLTRAETTTIGKMCGGNPNLLKGVAKYLNTARNKPARFSTMHLLTKHEVVVRVLQIYKSFNSEELEILRRLVGGKRIRATQSSYRLLKTVGVINHQNQIFSPLFSRFLKDRLLRETAFIKKVNNKIFINETNKNSEFTTNELLLLGYLVGKRNKVVSRDTIFESVWKGDVDRYSDWSLDQLVKRVRKKLAKYNLTKSFLTIKGIGYMWYEG